MVMVVVIGEEVPEESVVGGQAPEQPTRDRHSQERHAEKLAFDL
jgi:hypothetical protein